MNIVIIGGNAAGMSAASRIRRRAPEHEVIVLESTNEVSFGACGMPYYVAGLNSDINLMRIRPVEKFREQGIDVRLGHTVTAVDRDAKTVSGVNENGKFTVQYDRLAVCSGSSAIVPPIEGKDLAGVFTLKNLSDAAALKAALGEDRRVVIVGGGYIGLELAEACLLRNVKSLTVVEAAPKLLTTFDDEFGDAAAEELRKHGAEVRLGERVAGFQGKGGKLTAVETDGGIYDCDVAVLAVGVRPNTAFVDVEKLGNGALITDRSLRTGDPDIFAAGDCATAWHRLLKSPVYLPLGTHANKQGRLLGDAILGKEVCLDRALGTSMLRLAGLEFACTGISEKIAREKGIPYKTKTVAARSHARYFPDPAEITVKLVYSPDTHVILGAQMMGAKETALRIDIFALAVDRAMTTEELGFADLGYAPPFASVWDAVQIAANAAK